MPFITSFTTSGQNFKFVHQTLNLKSISSNINYVPKANFYINSDAIMVDVSIFVKNMMASRTAATLLMRCLVVEFRGGNSESIFFSNQTLDGNQSR